MGPGRPSSRDAGTRGQVGGALPLLTELAETQARASEIALELARIQEDPLAECPGFEAPCDLPELEPLLNVNDLANALNVQPSTIRRWRREGKLPKAIVVGGVVRWRPQVVEQWLLAREGEDR